jgi:hypothetical protein
MQPRLRPQRATPPLTSRALGTLLRTGVSRDRVRGVRSALGSRGDTATTPLFTAAACGEARHTCAQGAGNGQVNTAGKDGVRGSAEARGSGPHHASVTPHNELAPASTNNPSTEEHTRARTTATHHGHDSFGAHSLLSLHIP